jgi:dTDP-4-amino-4,6-dideoxygalactose transaminase
MPAMIGLARSRNLNVIEDACEAIGAECGGRRAGTFGEMGCFGFYPNKQMTTGEGGMIVTDDEATADLCRSLRNQGRDVPDELMSQRLGYNYRLTEIACAIGLVQLDRLEELQNKRARVAGWYNERLCGIEGVECPAPAAPDMRLSWFVYVVRLAEAARRKAVAAALASAGIPSRRYFHPIHLQPHFVEQFGYGPGDFPNAEHLGATSLALPFSSVMTEAAVERVCTALRDAAGGV